MLDVDIFRSHVVRFDAWFRAFSSARCILWWWRNGWDSAFRAYAYGIIRTHAREYFDSLDLAIRALIAENPYIVGE